MNYNKNHVSIKFFFKFWSIDVVSKRLATMGEAMLALEQFAEQIQQQQRNSNEFQMQLMKLSDASELEKGVTKVGNG